MTTKQLSKDYFLKIARTIVFTKGLDQLSIRHLAKEANVAVGSVYNYFPSKNSLILELINDFLKEIFYEDFRQMSNEKNFLSYLDSIYSSLMTHQDELRALFVTHLKILDKELIENLRTMSENYHEHIYQGILSVYDKDQSISYRVSNKDYLINLVMREMMVSLSRLDQNIDELLSLLNELLYKKNHF